MKENWQEWDTPTDLVIRERAMHLAVLGGDPGEAAVVMLGRAMIIYQWFKEADNDEQ